MKKKSEGMLVFGAIVTLMLSIVNLSHMLWTWWLVSEQIETGWGYGTNMEMGVLYPWMTELICVPAMIAAVVYLIMSCFKGHSKLLLALNILLFVCALGQFVVTNLFIWN